MDVSRDTRLNKKQLEFQEVVGPKMDWDMFEIRVKDMVNKMFKPQTMRVLDLQKKFGDMCFKHQTF